MAITYTWTVIQMDCYPEVDGDADVVFTVHWSLTGTDEKHTGSVYGSQAVKVDPDAPFIPYEKLSEERVLSWVWDAMGAKQVSAYEDSVAGQIANQINPPVVTPPLPW